MFDDRVSQADIRSAMTVLRDAGVASVKIHFSGGNDEGGADDTTFLDAEGNKVDGLPSSNAHASREWLGQGKGYGPETWIVHGPWVAGQGSTSRPATDEEIRLAKVAQVLESPIYSEYGSFAGEFYVDGSCTWDVATGKSEMHGQYESRSWEEF